jgi:alpha-galactosidase
MWRRFVLPDAISGIETMTKIVLIGAGSMQFGTGMLGDIFTSQTLRGCEIVLHDIDAGAANRMAKRARDHIAYKGLDHVVHVEPDLVKALAGCHFVVISIEVGDRFELWDMDWNIPQQYGVTQVYGENGGAGGLFHSLRIIPHILEICGKIMDHAPHATVFNYSNPMSRICTTVHRAYPDLTFVGMCHEIASLERHLPTLLNQPRRNIRYRAAGLNHLSVMAQCQYVDSGADAYPDVRARADTYFGKQPGYSEILSASRATGQSIDTEGWMDIDLDHIKKVRPWSDRQLFKVILDRFGMLPITYDSHFGEYIQWAHDCSDHRGILDFYTYYRQYLGARTPDIGSVLQERVVPIIDALLDGNAYEEAAVNIPNAGFIQGLPDWIVVEVPAMIGPNALRGIAVDLPAGIRGLLSNQIGVHDLTADAVLHKSRDLVVQALLVDPVVTVSKGIDDLVDHMISEQAPWLDYLK